MRIRGMCDPSSLAGEAAMVGLTGRGGRSRPTSFVIDDTGVTLG